MEKTNIHQLFKKFVDNRCTEHEIDRLMVYFGHPSSYAQLRKMIEQELAVLSDSSSSRSIDKIVHKVDRRMSSTFEALRNEEKKKKRNLHIIRWSAAAACLLFASIAFWQNAEKQSPLPLVAQGIPDSTGEILPGKEQARLTLYNGEQYEFGNSDDPIQGKDNTILRYVDGKLVYCESNEDEALQWNVLDVPKAGTFAMQLPDSSKVWLNANSKLYFPNRFPKNERSVKIEGEVFFEVRPDKKRPFKVQTGDLHISVLGTSFNVRAYQPAHIATTLVEGRVQLDYQGQTLTMSPGENVFIASDGRLKLRRIDIESATAWKEGYFYFKDETLAKILQDVVNWYDLTISIGGTLPDTRYSGSIDRNSNLSGVLNMLSAVAGLDFERNGNHLTVKLKNNR
ncbi:DUF4974 domain-containing protein [Sphingobacterium phlebotomi]|uniref:DUF4974 domain-containing protein n=1 Tax=Sphingobacterium phlebotomi TaxID=2605433 RepID=A0A5D4H8J9_9SPHI|nr:FecR domain-containing protein [Sphingobacterium phlebotomi]TYR36907.1 DUF4974 domain-containing protein [Sphingobacterium phlebotomi]